MRLEKSIEFFHRQTGGRFLQHHRELTAVSKFNHVSEHPLSRLLDSAGLARATPAERSALHRLLLTAAREAALHALLEPRARRPVIVGAGMWAAWQNRTGDAPRPSIVDFEKLPPARRQPWIELGASVLPHLVAEVLA
jgi:hypothetical protein